MRSRIPVIQARAKEIITELRKNKDVLDLVLDEFAPLKGETEPSATSDDKKTPEPTCKLEINKGEFCGAVESDSIHGFEDHQHRFRARKPRTKRVIPESVTRQISEDVKKAQEIQTGACVRCPNPSDANIHHLANTPGYHEFKEAA